MAEQEKDQLIEDGVEEFLENDEGTCAWVGETEPQPIAP
jgi:hypothetical protein